MFLRVFGVSFIPCFCGAFWVNGAQIPRGDIKGYTARCITASQDSGISKHKGEHSAVFFEYDGVYPVINPDRETIRQNGPRIRPNGAPAHCLTVVDRHGILHNGGIRRLHPQECFRLMGFSDEQFYKLKNELKLSDSKLYKLAGNSITFGLTRDMLKVDADMDVDCDIGQEITVYFETWFDVDKKFSTHIHDEDGT